MRASASDILDQLYRFTPPPLRIYEVLKRAPGTHNFVIDRLAVAAAHGYRR
jgi:hypothetical protein